MRCPVCSCKVPGFPCEVCGHDARTRPVAPEAPPEAEPVPTRYATFHGTRLYSISIEVPLRYGPSVLEALLGPPLAPPFDDAYQGGLHLWPVDLEPRAGLHGSPEEP